jgi:hypothetical protein
MFAAKIASKLSPQLEISPIKPEWICQDAEIVCELIFNMKLLAKSPAGQEVYRRSIGVAWWPQSKVLHHSYLWSTCNFKETHFKSPAAS